MKFCTVFRSTKNEETYLYLAEGQTYDDLPRDLRRAFGDPILVMRLRLDAGRPLARVDINDVIKQLGSQGYYLQLPPEIPVEEEISRRFS